FARLTFPFVMRATCGRRQWDHDPECSMVTGFTPKVTESPTVTKGQTGSLSLTQDRLFSQKNGDLRLPARKREPECRRASRGSGPRGIWRRRFRRGCQENFRLRGNHFPAPRAGREQERPPISPSSPCFGE